MHFHLVLLSLPIVVLGSSAFDESIVDTAMESMESGFPGSVNAFIEWGNEEAKIAQCFSNLYVPSGLINRPYTVSQFASLVFYMRPKISNDELRSHARAALANGRMTGLGTAPKTSENLVLWSLRYHEVTTRIPESVFTIIATQSLQARTAGLPINVEAISSIIRADTPSHLVSYWRPEIIKHWISRCILPLAQSASAGTSPPCKLNKTTKMWTMSESTRSAIFRHVCMQAVNSQNL